MWLDQLDFVIAVMVKSEFYFFLKKNKSLTKYIGVARVTNTYILVK